MPKVGVILGILLLLTVACRPSVSSSLSSMQTGTTEIRSPDADIQRAGADAARLVGGDAGIDAEQPARREVDGLTTSIEVGDSMDVEAVPEVMTPICVVDLATDSTVDLCGAYCCEATLPYVQLCVDSTHVGAGDTLGGSIVARCGPCTLRGARFVGDVGFHAWLGVLFADSSPDTTLWGLLPYQQITPGQVIPVSIKNAFAVSGANAELSMEFLPFLTEDWEASGWLSSVPVTIVSDSK